LQLEITTIIFFFLKRARPLIECMTSAMYITYPGREQGENGGDFTASPEEQVLPWSVIIVLMKPLAGVMFSCGT
jgi:hypothetical protein